MKIKDYSHIFSETVEVYRKAVDFFMSVCIKEWNVISSFSSVHVQMMYIENMCHATKTYPEPKYDFDSMFYKMPSYIRRSAITEAIGKVSSYKSNLANWEKSPKGKRPRPGTSGRSFPTLYKDNMFKLTGEHEAKIKICRHGNWEWLSVTLRKTDMEYIARRCNGRKRCAPTLMKRGKQWFLDFPFEEKTNLTEECNIVIGVDLGINTACTCVAMGRDGTVYGRHFLSLPSEKDHLEHAIGRIKKAQRYGNRKTPRLWAKAKGINDDIAVKTAAFIMDIAAYYDADAIVFEHLDIGGKVRGSKKQRLALWKARYVQSMVRDKAHRACMHISHVNAWNTSRLAFDGSGVTERGGKAGLPSYSLCRFASGKVYNCDLNAAYNIAARYFIRDILKSAPATERLALEAKVPGVAKRSTCTLADLINLNAEREAV